MQLSWDKPKRQLVLLHRGIDFADAGEVFAGPTYDFADTRRDYGEQRMISVGFLNDRMTVVVWKPRGNTRRIISMRKANEREINQYSRYLD